MLYIHTVVVLLSILTHKSLPLLGKIIQMYFSRIFFLMCFNNWEQSTIMWIIVTLGYGFYEISSEMKGG